MRQGRPVLLGTLALPAGHTASALAALCPSASISATASASLAFPPYTWACRSIHQPARGVSWFGAKETEGCHGKKSRLPQRQEDPITGTGL